MDASVLEVNRLLGEVTVKSPVTEHTNSTIVKNVLTIERKHLVRSRGAGGGGGRWDLMSVFGDCLWAMVSWDFTTAVYVGRPCVMGFN